MKKIILTILALTMIVSLFGCDTVSEEGTTAQKEQETNLATDADDNTEKGTNKITETEIKIEINTEKETIPSEINKEYLITDSGKYIYCSAGESASGINDGYRYKDVKELGLVSSTPEYSYSVDETKEKTKRYNFNKKEVELEYYKSQICLKETSGLVAKYNNYDKYKDASGTVYSFFTEDNKLRHYYTKNEIQQGNTTKISKEQAIQISNNFLIDLLSEEIFNTYTMDENKNVSIMYNEYWISYAKYFHGFRTTDTITMRINMEGSISAYVGLYVSLYDEAMKTITYNDIIDAEAELMAALYLPNMRVVDEVIEMNDNGEVCLAMYTVHGGDLQYGDVFYLPITHYE